MRYVIIIVAATVFLGWEMFYSDWLITSAVLREISRLRGIAGL